MNQRRLLLNVCPIKFDDAELSATVLPFESGDQLRNLRSQYRTSYLFRRQDTRVIAIPLVLDPPCIGQQKESLSLYKNLWICADLVRNAYINYLSSIGRKVQAYDPVKFIADGVTNNLLNLGNASTAELPDWLSLRPLYEISARVVYLDGRSPFLACGLNVRTTRIIDVSCAELLDLRFDIGGLYVGERVARNDPRLAPKFRLVGSVREVDSDRVILLSDHRVDCDSIRATSAFLDPHDAFEKCLTHFLGPRLNEVKAKVSERLVEIKSGPGRLKLIKAALKYLGGLSLELVPGSKFSLGEFLTESDDFFPKVQEGFRPVYVFDPAGSQTDRWHDRGLEVYGPYTSQTFTPTRPRICVICQKTKKGQVEQFVQRFLRGMSVGGMKRNPFATGFVGKYRLEGCQTEFFVTNDDSAEAYRQTALDAVQHSAQSNIRWDLALVQIEEEFHQLIGQANPYLVTKGLFLTHQIPVQEFEIETTRLPDNQLSYVLNNMALATYAKLGGIPWLIKANPTIAHELVIGLGSAQVGSGRLRDRERIVGVTTVFSGDGNYRLSNLSTAVPIEGFKDALLTSLRSTVERIRQAMNWQPRDHVRLVFHAFKPMKETEAEAVKSLMAELGDFDLEYAFLHVVADHPFVLFDEAQPGEKDFATRRRKGANAPARGLFFRFSNREVLMSLVGPREVKRPEDGMPRPIILRLHPASTFADISYLSHQVYAFAGHSWRSFFPSNMPVTIMYSQLIAKMLGNLATLPHWNPDVMVGRISNTRWFL
jgi:hypothetical protein